MTPACRCSYNPNLRNHFFWGSTDAPNVVYKSCAPLLCLPIALASSPSRNPPLINDVLIKNATVMTVTHGNIKNGSIYIKDGKIAAVGANRTRACRRHRH